MRSQRDAEIVPTDSARAFDEAVQRAAAALRAGELVAVPTETVYGLAANALDAVAVERIFRAKGRPPHNPIIVHVASLEMARQCVASWPRLADLLAATFWPGPLTLVLPRAKVIPDIVTAGGGTVGVRWPSHPFIQALIQECGFPLAAPSANPSNSVSPTHAAHVRADLGGKIKLIIDGGPSQVGIESTVVDLCSTPVRILRPGMIHAEEIAVVVAASTGGELGRSGDGAQILRSPGQLPKHYSPRTRLVILSWKTEEELREKLRPFGLPLSVVHVVAHSLVPSGEGWGGVSVIPHDADAFARAIYAELRRCDDEGSGLIVVEAVPTTPEWQAVADRLQRAAGAIKSG